MDYIRYLFSVNREANVDPWDPSTQNFLDVCLVPKKGYLYFDEQSLLCVNKSY